MVQIKNMIEKQDLADLLILEFKSVGCDQIPQLYIFYTISEPAVGHISFADLREKCTHLTASSKGKKKQEIKLKKQTNSQYVQMLYIFKVIYSHYSTPEVGDISNILIFWDREGVGRGTTKCQE